MGSRQHVVKDGDVNEQEYREDLPTYTDQFVGEDYGEWLASCPKEMPLFLRRQRHALPDVSFLASQGKEPASGKMVEDLDLGALVKILERLPASVQLDISADTCNILGIEYVSYEKDVVAGDSFAMRCNNCTDESAHGNGEDTTDSHKEHRMDTFHENQRVENKSCLEDDLDALLNLGGTPEQQSSAMIGDDEQEDLDAWFESL